MCEPYAFNHYKNFHYFFFPKSEYLAAPVSYSSILNVRFYIASTDSLVLEMHVQRECHLEIWEVEKQKST